MSKQDDEFVLTCIAVPIAALMVFLVVLLVSWIVVLTASGFGFELPFWSVFGVVFLIFLFVRWIK